MSQVQDAARDRPVPPGQTPARPTRTRARAGRSVARAGEYRVTQQNLYLLPTRAGLILGMVIFVMLVASVNYQLSLGYALCFMVAAVAIVSMLHSWRNLTSLTLRPGRATPVFAGDIAEFTVFVANPRAHERYALSFFVPGAQAPQDFDLAADSELAISLAIATPERGWTPIPRLRLETRFPVGLWRAWTWWHPAMRVLVYPRPEAGHVPLPIGGSGAGQSDSGGGAQEDLAALRPWQQGDSLRRVAWKAVARTDSNELLVRQFEGGSEGIAEFTWDGLPGDWDTERRLSRLTRWVIDADNRAIPFSLRLPSIFIAAESGPAHRERCLEALATWQAPSSRVR
jgi:uncharacterized protein (DUF58 family)